MDKGKKEGKKSKKEKSREISRAIGEVLITMNEIKGYLGCAVFSPQGKKLGGTTDMSGIHFDEVGFHIHNTLSNSKTMAKKVGFGKLDMIQLYSEMGIIFAKCFDEGNLQFHTILVIKSDGNVVQARLKLQKVVEEIRQVL